MVPGSVSTGGAEVVRTALIATATTPSEGDGCPAAWTLCAANREACCPEGYVCAASESVCEQVGGATGVVDMVAPSVAGRVRGLLGVVVGVGVVGLVVGGCL